MINKTSSNSMCEWRAMRGWLDENPRREHTHTHTHTSFPPRCPARGYACPYTCKDDDDADDDDRWETDTGFGIHCSLLRLERNASPEACPGGQSLLSQSKPKTTMIPLWHHQADPYMYRRPNGFFWWGILYMCSSRVFTSFYTQMVMTVITNLSWRRRDGHVHCYNYQILHHSLYFRPSPPQPNLTV
jgi:hypothetical protein